MHDMRRLTRLATAAMACACLGNLVAECLRALLDALNTDFVASFYTAADMLRHGDHAIYCASCLQEYARHELNAGAVIFSFQYDNPPLGAWLLQPLTSLGAQTALACFLVISLVAVAAAFWLLRHEIARTPRQLAIAVFAFASFPAAMTFAYGQWDALLALAVAGAYVALQRDRELLAGLLLAILLLKPQLVWLVPVVLIIAARWRLVAGFLVGTVVWGVSSIAILGWSQSTLWLHQISPNVIARTGLSLPHLLVAFGVPSSVVLTTAAALAVLASGVLIVARSWLHSLSRQQQLSLGLLLSLLAAPHLLSYDLIILGPLVVFWACDQERHALIAALIFSAAFLIDLALPMTWAIVEAPVLLGVAAMYYFDLRAPRARMRTRVIAAT